MVRIVPALKNHLRDREGWGFETLEAARKLPAAFDRLPADATVLFDSATALLANEMFRPDGTMDKVRARGARRSCSRWRGAAAIWSASATISGGMGRTMTRGQRNTGGSSPGSAGNWRRSLTPWLRSSAVCRSFTSMERTLYERLVLRLFMAWGMFWPSRARSRAGVRARAGGCLCLPLIGLVEGGLWALLVWLLAKLCLPEALGALCAAAFPWLVTGFLHLDSYMDVCDAVLSGATSRRGRRS